jgi:hypothetical protein
MKCDDIAVLYLKIQAKLKTARYCKLKHKNDLTINLPLYKHEALTWEKEHVLLTTRRIWFRF